MIAITSFMGTKNYGTLNTSFKRNDCPDCGCKGERDYSAYDSDMVFDSRDLIGEHMRYMVENCGYEVGAAYDDAYRMAACLESIQNC